MTVRFTTNPQKPQSKPAIDQEYFEDFNFDRMQAGDIVWIEDYTASDAKKKAVGIIARFDFNDPIIRLLPRKATLVLMQLDSIRKSQLTSVIGVNSYFENFMYR